MTISGKIVEREGQLYIMMDKKAAMAEGLRANKYAELEVRKKSR